MGVRVAMQVTLPGALLALLGAWALACVGSDFPTPAEALDAATDASVTPDSGHDGGPPPAPCACVETPGDGWSVPGFLVHDATCAAPVPMEAYKLYADVSGAPATCGKCSCNSPPTALTCVAPSIAVYTSGTCPAGAPTGAPVTLAGADCYANPNAASTSYRAETGTPQGACEATSDAIAVIPPLQKTDLRLCVPSAQTAGSCAAGTACRPESPASSSPLPSSLCIAHPGDVECPASYPNRQRLYATYEDKRRCTACSCTFSATGCEYTVKAYSAAACGGTLLTTATSGPACLSGSPKSFRVTAGTVTNAACGDPKGGVPSGDVEVSDAMTVCCKP